MLSYSESGSLRFGLTLWSAYAMKKVMLQGPCLVVLKSHPHPSRAQFGPNANVLICSFVNFVLVRLISLGWVCVFLVSSCAFRVCWVRNQFKKTNLKIAFRPTNTIYQQLSNNNKDPNPTGIYQLKCNTCNCAYVGQSGRPITTRHREHLLYIKTTVPPRHMLHTFWTTDTNLARPKKR